MVKLVAPDKDGAADKLCLGEGKPVNRGDFDSRGDIDSFTY